MDTSNVTDTQKPKHGELIVFYFGFPVPFIIFVFALQFSLPPSRNSDPGSHSRLFSPFPTTVCAFFFIARRLQPLFPHRLVSNCAYPRYALSAVDTLSFFFLK